MIFGVWGVQVRTKNRTKIDVKTRSRYGRLPRLHFIWFWVDLGSQVGAKLGGKIEPRQAKTGQDKGRQGKRREGKGKEEEGKGRERRGVEKCGIGPPSAGRGGYPSLRGRLRWKSHPDLIGCLMVCFVVVLFVLCGFILSTVFEI